MESMLTKQEKGRVKKYLIEIYRTKSIHKEENTIVNELNILSLIDLLESNKEMNKEEIVNLKVILDSMMFCKLDSLKDNTSNYIYGDDILRCAYNKLIEYMKAS